MYKAKNAEILNLFSQYEIQNKKEIIYFFVEKFECGIEFSSVVQNRISQSMENKLLFQTKK